jgi:hypothetical protein
MGMMMMSAHLDSDEIEQLLSDQSVAQIAEQLRDHSDTFGAWMLAFALNMQPATVERADWLIDKLEMMLVAARVLRREIEKDELQQKESETP